MVDIHTMAATGRSIIEPMRTKKKTCTWDDLLLKGAQLARFPLNEDEPVRTQTVIGPSAQHPLTLDTPIYVSHMSFGALSREIKIALGKGVRRRGPRSVPEKEGFWKANMKPPTSTSLNTYRTSTA